MKRKIEKNLPTTGKYETKPYHCQKCGYEKQIGTNHFGECYSLGNYNKCPNCPPLETTIWVCDLPCPPDMQKPAPWKIVNIGDIIKKK